MPAGLSDQIWSLEEWLNFPVIQRNEDTARSLEMAEKEILI